MCGLAGFIGGDMSVAEGVAVAMADAIAHRGPDSSGVWVERESGCALAHRRLSIVDLTAAGHQPMLSDGGRFAMVFNGEIYNHLALREALGDRAWRGHSDTETLLAGFEAWGVEQTVLRTVGMFAIALFDRRERILHLVRDRVGEKPLYYAWSGDTFLFGSELKALQQHPAFVGEVDRGSLALLMRHGYVPAPYSIWRGVRKLPPGTVLSMSFADGSRAARDAVPHAYWSLQETIRTGRERPFTGDEREAVDRLESALLESVRLQNVADVPLGAFLSGGIDSSAIVALMQQVSSRPVKTFTIGFDDARHDEAPHARAVARHLGTEHHEHYLTQADVLAAIPGLPAIYDEPFADASQIPTSLVCAAARRHVTVALSGDGGDELFGGYSRHLFGATVGDRVVMAPRSLRDAMGAAMKMVPASVYDGINTSLGSMLPQRLRINHAGEKMARVARVLAASGPEALYSDIVSKWEDPAALVIDGWEPPTPVNTPCDAFKVLSVGHLMMALDTATYLPDDVLVKVDRAAMATSLETRVPLLDHRVIELAWSMPLTMKISGGISKRVLRSLLYRHVPRELIERPKQGFAVPLDRWLREGLRDWAESLLDPSLLSQQGYLRSALVRERWNEHLSGKRDWQNCLWNVLMFQAWLQTQRH
jgi:asparagine synthase (glutamine-hydrolysing)